MKYEKSVIENIKSRVSTRTFDDRAIQMDTLKRFESILADINASAKIKARFILAKGIGSGDKKLGTYGVISGAHTYIIGLVSKSESDASAFGYHFEEIVLAANDLGLYTCWLGGTFKKSDFEAELTMKDDEQIAIISPLGYKKDKQRVLEAAMRGLVGANRRKPWQELFFNETIEVALDERKAGSYAVPIEMVRLGPSASNKQPWRILKKAGHYHFYLCRTKGYGALNFDMQLNDIGIAMCHFELSAIELGLNGSWQKQDALNLNNDWVYVNSWICESQE
jgi:hypothetical protein